MEQHPSYQARATDTASTILSILAVVAVALRFWTRRITSTKFGPDDWWILVGLLGMLLTGAVLLYGVRADPDAGQGINRDDPNFDYAPHATYLKTSFITATLYFSVVTSIKISILHLYRRVFPVDETIIHSHIVGALVLAWWLVGSGLTIVSCLPVERLWIGPSAGGYCFNFNIYWMSMGAVEIMIDTLLLILPVRMVLGLQLSRQQKVLVVGIFALGGFVILTGLVRVITGYKPGSQNVAFLRAELWSAIHVCTAIICACLPTLRPVIKLTSATISSLRRKCGSSSNSRLSSSWTTSGGSNAASRGTRPPELSALNKTRIARVSADELNSTRDHHIHPTIPLQVMSPRRQLRHEDVI
ncbi:related to integral membrane protein [Rhynchosporium secalis]|uniref:Related to integral membrane protein n=1 Tax=Rhynchosporium secalis TaxID=38038 RepID=A0A1E1M5K7_RHYSE|nr:related to integral membrane protein [Rhynchosporium secalis]